ncbi:hypothetical protein HELRODRAFT_180365 [Helobdella robusta]|uniref:Uncharacterized protein n=1 Tax=Helobdella robusta TaxID=6412 RepID=T1FFU3_HELRO|nr:hypothetical protein HELRODRAFT_180365 [Helobdella robusta]ESN93956.1 hypothetical protein HELRODRAFT_180365 [Helobdella robusta]
MTMYFDRWLAMADVNQTYEAIRNYIILDTVINAYSDQVQVFVKERCPRTLDALTTLIRLYKTAHPNQILSRPTTVQTAFFATTKTNNSRLKTNVEYGRTDKRYNGQQNTKKVNDNSSPYCEICGKNNHRADNCYFRNSNKPQTHNTDTTRKLPMQYKPVNKVFFCRDSTGRCPYLTGWYKTLVLDQPLDGTDLIIGNITDVKDCTRSDVIQWQNNHEVNRSMLEDPSLKKLIQHRRKDPNALIMKQEYGELANECSDVYYSYGKALLELHGLESTTLGNVLKSDDENDDDENDEIKECKDKNDDNSSAHSGASKGLVDEECEKTRNTPIHLVFVFSSRWYLSDICVVLLETVMFMAASYLSIVCANTS